MGLNYTKFRDGKIIQVIKDKDENREVKETAFIEIFDEQGKVVESFTENVVCAGLKRSAYMDFNYAKIKGNSNTTYYNGLMNCLMGSDATDTENENIILPHGKMIFYGFKNQQYSGDNIYKASYNSVESDMDTKGTGLIRFIFDCPPHTGN